MESKKSAKADLEKKKGLFMEIGLVTILALILVAFNLRSTEKKDTGLNIRQVSTEMEEEILNTEEDKPQEPEPEVEQPEPEVTTELEIVDNDAELTHELQGVNADDNANTAQGDFAPINDEPEALVEEEEIFIFVDEQASFPGGDDALLEYLSKNIQYPEMAAQNGIEGTVVVKFVVEKDGSITKAQILREIGGGCGKEALRVVNAMPKWKPGKQGVKTVRSEFTLPVQFELH